MRQMILDYAQTMGGVELDIMIVDTDTRQYAREKNEFISMERAVETVGIILLNVNVDVVYADQNGLGTTFIEVLDKFCMDNRIPAIIDGMKQVSPNVMYRPREVVFSGHKIETSFDY